MREIKFRTWDGKRLITDPRFDCYCAEDLCGLGCNVNECFSQTDHVFMQYTGLKLNGVEVYEGDILSYTYPAREEITEEMYREREKRYAGVTFFNEPPHPYIPPHTDYVEVMWDEENGEWDIPRDYDGLLDLDRWEVAGNVYENPGLIKEAK